MKLTLDEILKATNGQLIKSGGNSRFEGVCIDTRIIKNNEAFVAVKGDALRWARFCGGGGKKGGRRLLWRRPRCRLMPM